jgi:hypothetical protein
VHPDGVAGSARRLRILVRTSAGALPMLVAAGVTPFAACGGDTERDPSDRGGGAGTAMADASSGGGFGGTGGSLDSGVGGLIVPSTGGGGGTAGGNACAFGVVEELTVQLPPEGVPAEPGQICATSTEPVGSYRAARVTLAAVPGDAAAVTGRIEIDERIAAEIVGLPVVEVVESTHVDAVLTVSELVANPSGGYDFRASWAGPVQSSSFAPVRVSVRTQLELRCAPGSSVTRRVHALTEIYLCMEDYDDPTPVWVSSGDTCIVCRVIAEMAPSPIVPDKQADDLPLARALRLRIVELARVSNSLVLLAENDGGEGLAYEWYPSEGRVEQLAPDIIAWTLEPGARAPIIQVAVMSEHAAAVASRGFYEAA